MLYIKALFIVTSSVVCSLIGIYGAQFVFIMTHCR